MAPDAPTDLELFVLPPSAETALAAFAEPARRWLAQRFAWPALAAGKNLLLCAPTGSGKTLAAFLPILDQLLAAPVAGGVRCLYVAPLKALGNDARKNLRAHLQGIRQVAPGAAVLRV